MIADIQAVLSGERRWCVVEGDSLLTLREMPSESIDSIVCDPPYGLGDPPHLPSLLRDWLATGYHEVSGRGFMGQAWDAFVPQPILWAECLRVLKPGGHLIAFAGTRTQHMMALGIQFAGFELRDLIGWIYGTGFPKSLDVSKAIDKAAGAEREVVGRDAVKYSKRNQARAAGVGEALGGGFDYEDNGSTITAPATPAARQWHGWGTALKPAIEPITLARKPLRGTVAANVLAHGTGAINIDGCRVEANRPHLYTPPAGKAPSVDRQGRAVDFDGEWYRSQEHALGRFPANLVHDGSEEALAGFPDSDPHFSDTPIKATGLGFGSTSNGGTRERRPKDAGSAARFFYSPKASKADREEGLDAFPAETVTDGRETPNNTPRQRGTTERRNTHPTVKPTELMRYLCRLITPSGGVVLDPFAGSGSTGKAAQLEGFRFIGIDLDEKYCAIARARITAAGEPSK